MRGTYNHRMVQPVGFVEQVLKELARSKLAEIRAQRERDARARAIQLEKERDHWVDEAARLTRDNESLRAQLARARTATRTT